MITTFSGAPVRSETSEAGKFSRAPVPPPVVGLTHVARLGDERQEVIGGQGAEPLAQLERELEGGASQVRQQDVQVVRVEPRLLGPAAQQERRVVDDVPVDGRGGRDDDGHAHVAASTGTADLLPRRRDGARIAGEDRHIEPADVDAQLERVRGHDAQHLAVAQPALDGASFGGQIARAIAADPGARAEVLAQRLAKRREHDLDRGPRPPEDHRLATRPKERAAPTAGPGSSPNRAPRSRGPGWADRPAARVARPTARRCGRSGAPAVR